MTQNELAELALKVFAEKYVGKLLRAYRPTGQGVQIDVVDLEQAEPKLAIWFENTCIRKQVIPQRLHNAECDPVKAFHTCLEADILDAVILTSARLPQLDDMIPRMGKHNRFGNVYRPAGWVYHLEGDRSLTVFEFSRNPPQLSVMGHGHFRMT